MSGRPARVAITGGYGFLGWHLACRLRAMHGIEPLRLGRRELADPQRLLRALETVDTVYHLAGVNRAETDDEVERGNVDVARSLATALDAMGRPIHVVYANSIQADVDNPYGRGKRGAADILGEAVRSAGCTLADVILPNLFGEHGRPEYNSFVATFADAVAGGREPRVSGDRQVELLHAQRAAQTLIDSAAKGAGGTYRPTGSPRGVVEVLNALRGFHTLYAERGEFPDVGNAFAVDLFNTYRSYVFPQKYPMFPAVHRDARGDLFETVRAHGGTGQAFASTTVPGALRGDHYHLNKIERFFVVKGQAEIKLRRLLHEEVVTFQLSGDRPGFVDMPTLWVHNIRNVGSTELVTVFWTDQLLDPGDPDQYAETVEVPTK